LTLNIGSILGLEVLFGHRKYITTVKPKGEKNYLLKISLDKAIKYKEKLKLNLKNLFDKQISILTEFVNCHSRFIK
jgi:hypothetical protein